MNDYVHIGTIESVEIGNNVLIASKAFIKDHNHGYYGKNGKHSSPLVPPEVRELSSSFVKIKNNVWIGEFATILPRATIGESSVICSMSVMTQGSTLWRKVKLRKCDE